MITWCDLYGFIWLEQGMQGTICCLLLAKVKKLELRWLRFLYKIPIFRRLFMTFMIVAVIPAIIIVLLDNFYLSSLTTRGQAVQISFDAQSIASTEQGNLLRMNALLQTRHDQVFAASPTVCMILHWPPQVVCSVPISRHEPLNSISL